MIGLLWIRTPPSPILNGRGEAVSAIRHYRRIDLPVAVVAELHFGAINSGKSLENLQKVQQLLARCTLLDASVDTARTFAELRLTLKRKGRPIPENDLWIAATCVQHGIPLVTDDRHFAEVDGLQVISIGK